MANWLVGGGGTAWEYYGTGEGEREARGSSADSLEPWVVAAKWLVHLAPESLVRISIQHACP